MKMAMTRSASTPLVQLIVSMALALLVWLAMSPDFFADKTSGDFVAFLGAAGLLAKPIRQLTQINFGYSERNFCSVQYLHSIR
ncbi:MAG: hypothetical protein CM1200mP40_33950 [Gammaproteobacteria bacterium]|nr:MAG: hypothetical protein CM1200mP40_33950 [Gammaproteobacteria bacterium]